MGIAMPKDRGAMLGHVVTINRSVATGKRFPWVPPGKTEPVWLPVKETRVIIVWAWDGRKWIRGDEWAARFIRTAPPGTKFPSKNDVDDNGYPVIRRAGPRRKRPERKIVMPTILQREAAEKENSEIAELEDERKEWQR
jgi:hypothetical protein